MRRINLFETGIMGFFVGVIVASYWAFLESAGGAMGNILRFISLTPVLDSLNKLGGVNFSAGSLVYISFIFFVIVYTIYGVILGLIFRAGMKVKIIFTLLILALLVGIYFEQCRPANLPHKVESNNALAANLSGADSSAPSKKIEQYFGEIEARGDVNEDGKDDVAFIISRKDPDRGMLYYLTVALDIKKGYQGTNLLFMGDKIEPKNIDIEDNVIIVDYVNHAVKVATSSPKMYAKIVKDVLIEDKTATSTSANASINATPSISAGAVATSTKSAKPAKK